MPLRNGDTQNPARWHKMIRYNHPELICNKELKDDNGKLFGFDFHLYRHYYGVKLPEIYLDDWTIAKLLDHKDIRSVHYYRRYAING